MIATAIVGAGVVTGTTGRAATGATAVPAGANKKAQRSGGRDMGFDRTVLPSGVRVVTEQLPGQRSVSIGAWVGTGFDGWGWLRPGAHGSLRVFPRAARGSPACLRVTLTAPQLAAGQLEDWRIGGRHGLLAGLARTRVDVPLRGTQPLDLVVKASPSGRDQVTGMPALVELTDLHVATCGAPEPPPRLDP